MVTSILAGMHPIWVPLANVFYLCIGAHAFWIFPSTTQHNSVEIGLNFSVALAVDAENIIPLDVGLTA